MSKEEKLIRKEQLMRFWGRGGCGFPTEDNAQVNGASHGRMGIEFKTFGKITRDNPFKVTITEKLNGTNACIIIEDGKVVGVQSRKRLITPENDNYGFAGWVYRNEEDLVKLEDGYHFGEWAGLGIQLNHHQLDEKKFFLFNTVRWNEDNPNRPSCCEVVRTIFEGDLEAGLIDKILCELKDNAKEGETPEGIIVYYHAFRTRTKHTIINKEGKWKR